MSSPLGSMGCEMFMEEHVSWRESSDWSWEMLVT
jgi:hypothetical protein